MTSLDIVNKKGKLSDEEFRLMKEHPIHGAEMLVELGEEDMDILAGVVHHHEKLNGQGYPSGLTGSQVPLFAQLIAIADVFAALSTKRSYDDGAGAEEVSEGRKSVAFISSDREELQLLRNAVGRIIPAVQGYGFLNLDMAKQKVMNVPFRLVVVGHHQQGKTPIAIIRELQESAMAQKTPMNFVMMLPCAGYLPGQLVGKNMGIEHFIHPQMEIAEITAVLIPLL